MTQGRIWGNGHEPSWSGLRKLFAENPKIETVVESHPCEQARSWAPAAGQFRGRDALGTAGRMPALLLRIFSGGTQALQGFVMGLPRIAARDLLVPGRVKGPRPRFTDSATRH